MKDATIVRSLLRSSRAWRKLLFVLSALALATAGNAQAQSQTWDPNGTFTGSFGSGTWNAGNTNWAAGGTDGVWGGAANTAIFGGTQSGTATVTLGSAISATGLTFNTSGYDLVTSAANTLSVSGTTTLATNVTTEIDGPGFALGTVAMTTGSVLTLTGGGSMLGVSGGTLDVTSGAVNANGTESNVTINLTGTGEITNNPFGNFQTGTVNINETSNSTTAISSGSGVSQNFGRGAGSVATMNLTSGIYTMGGGTALLTISGGSGSTVTTSGTINVQGGTLNATNGLGIVIDGITGSVTGSGTLALSSGTVNTNAIWFGTNGSATTVTSSGTAALTVTGGTLYIGTGGIVSNVTGQTQKITLSGGVVGALGNWSSSMNMSLVAGTGPITFQAANSSATAENITLSGNLSNGASNGGLTKTGAGTLTLSGANTYSGGTTLNAGTLALNNGASGTTTSSAIGTGTLTIAGGTIDSTVSGITLGTNNTENWNGNFTFAGTNSLNLGTGAVTLGGNEQVTVTANTLTVGGAIGGSGDALTEAGSGTLALAGSNTYSGATSVTAGTLSLTGTLTGSNVSTSGSGIVSESTAGVIAGTGTTFTQGSTGLTTLAGANTYTGGTSITGGTLQFAKTNAMSNTGTVAVGAAGTLVVNAGGTGEFTGATSGNGSIGALLGGTGGQGAPVTYTAGSFLGIDTTNAGGSLTYTGNVASSLVPVLDKLGTGTLSITGTVDAPELEVGAGTLALSGGSAGTGFLNANTQSFGPGTLLISGGTYTTTTNFVFGLDLGTAATLGSTTAPTTGVQMTGGTWNFGGGTFGIARNASGVFVLNGGTLAGNTKISISRAGGAGNTGEFFLESGTLNLSSASSLSMAIGDSGTATGNGELVVTGGTFNNGNNIIQVNGGVTAGEGLLELAGGTTTTGTIEFGASGTFTTGSAILTQTAGTLYLGSGGLILTSGATGLTPSITLSGGIVGATANWASSLNMTLGTTNGNITFQTLNASNAAENISLSGQLSGSGGLTVTGTTGVLSLSGSNSYGGGTTITSGTLKLTQANSLPTSGTVSVGAAGTLLANAGGTGEFAGGTGNGTVGQLLGATYTSGAVLAIDTTNATAAVSTSANVSSTTILDKLGTGTLSISGTVDSPELLVGGGTLALSGGSAGTGFLNAGAQSSGPGTLLISGGTYTTTTNFVFGLDLGTAATLGSTTAPTTGVQMTGGTWNFGGGTFGIARNANGVFVLNGGTLAGTTKISISRAGGAGNTGEFFLESGTLNLSSASSLSMAIGDSGTATGNGELVVTGGTFNNGNNIIQVNGGVTAGEGLLELAGGTTTTGTIEFGGGVANSTGSALLTQTAGTLYVGSGGLILTSGTTGLTPSITLSGGIVGATANWASSLNMTLGTTNGNITFQTLNASNAAENISLSGQISGSGGLTVTGTTGVLSLSGSNSYGGGTTITGGTLQMANASALGSANSYATSLTINGGTLDLDGNNFNDGTGFTFSSGAIIDNSNTSVTLTVGNSNVSGTYAGNLKNNNNSNATSGTLAVTKTGSGTITLSGTNTNTGATQVNAGILNYGASGAIATGSTITVANNAAVQLSDGVQGGASSATITIMGTGASAGASGAVEYLGTSGVNEGGIGQLLVLGGSATISSDTPGALFDLSNTGTIMGNGFNLTVSGGTGGGATEIDSVIGTGSGALIVNGGGTLVLTNQSTFTGGTTVSNGATLVIGANNALLSTGAVVLGESTGNTTGILQLGTSSTHGFNQTLTSLTTSGSGTSNAVVGAGNASNISTLTINNSTSDVFAGKIGKGSPGSSNLNDVALTKTGAGTLTLSGTSNTFIGAVAVQAGTLSFTTGNASATGSQSLGENVSLTLGVASSSSGILNYTGSGAGTLAKSISALGNGSDTIENSGGGLLTLSGGLVKNGTKLTLNGGANGINVTTTGISGASAGSDLDVTGLVTLSVASSYNGPTNISGTGTLITTVANALPNLNSTPSTTPGLLTLGASGDTSANTNTLDLDGTTQTVSGITNLGTGTVNQVINNNGTAGTLLITPGTGVSNTFAGLLGGSGSTKNFGVTLNAVDSTGVQVLTGANIYTGPTNVQQGTLQLGTGGSLASATAVTLGNSTGNTSGVFELGDGSNLVNQTVSGLSTSGSGSSNAVIGGNSSASTLTVNNNSADTYGGVIGGPTGNQNNINLVKSGSSTLTLSGANTYTGTTQVNAGVLSVTGSLGSGTAVTVGGAGASSGATIAGTGVIGGNVVVASAGVGNAGTFSPGTTGTPQGMLTVGTINFQTGSTFDVNINGANTSLLTITGSGAGALTIGGGTTNISFTSTGTLSGDYLLANITGGGTVSGTFSNAINLPGGYQLVYTSSQIDLDPLVTSATNAYFNGAGSDMGTATNFDTGQATGVTGGSLVAGTNVFFSANRNTSSQASPTSATLSTLTEVNSVNFGVGSAVGEINSGITISTSNASTLQIDAVSGTNGNPTNNGISITGSGSDTISAPVALGGSQSWTTASGSTLTVSGQVSGTGFSLTKAGSGAVVLTNDNAYTGGTTVSGGTLYVNNGGGASYSAPTSSASPRAITATNSTGSGTGTGLVTVSSGGTLAGSGTIAPTSGGVVVNNGGTLASGGLLSTMTATAAGPGLTLNNSSNLSSILTVNGGGTLTFDLASTVNGAGSGGNAFTNPNTNSTYLSLAGNTVDQIFSNTTTADSVNLVDLTVGSPTVTLTLRYQNPYLLIQTALGNNADFANLVTTGGTGANGYVLGVSNGTGGYTAFNIAMFNTSGGQINTPLNYGGLRLYLENGDLEVIPEPGTWALMLGGLALLVFIQQRRSRNS